MSAIEKWHITIKGEKDRCHAQFQCPLIDIDGRPSLHFYSAEAAQAYIDEKHRQEAGGLFNSIKLLKDKKLKGRDNDFIPVGNHFVIVLPHGERVSPEVAKQLEELRKLKSEDTHRKLPESKLKLVTVEEKQQELEHLQKLIDMARWKSPEEIETELVDTNEANDNQTNDNAEIRDEKELQQLHDERALLANAYKEFVYDRKGTDAEAQNIRELAKIYDGLNPENVVYRNNVLSERAKNLKYFRENENLKKLSNEMFDCLAKDKPGGWEFADTKESRELSLFYTDLALRHNADKPINLEDVHEAWAQWTMGFHPRHKSMVSFDKLPKAVQDLDKPYLDVIIKMSEKWHQEE